MVRYTAAHQEKVVVLWLGSKVLEDALFPVSLHMIPVINKSMTNRIMQAISLRVSHGLVSDEEIKVLNPTLRGKISRL